MTQELERILDELAAVDQRLRETPADQFDDLLAIAGRRGQLVELAAGMARTAEVAEALRTSHNQGMAAIRRVITARQPLAQEANRLRNEASFLLFQE